MDPFGNPNAFDTSAGTEYPGYRQHNTFSYDPGVIVLPLASREPETVTVRLHGGLGIRKVTVAATKRGAPPIIPAATDTDRDTLISCSVNVPLPSFMGDAPTFLWTVAAEYLYVTTEGGPRIPGRDMLPAGQYPFPLPLQDAAGEALLAGGQSLAALAAELKNQIPTGDYIWPFTIYPPQFFNSILLRDNDIYQDQELRGGE